MFLNEQVYGYHDREQKTLPPRIPRGTLILLPRNAVDRRSNTRHMPMWAPPTDEFPDNPALWDPYGVVGPLFSNVPFALVVMNELTAFRNWRAPSRAELDDLLSRGPAGRNARDFLLGLHVTWPRTFIYAINHSPYIWTTQPAGVPAWDGSPVLRCRYRSDIDGIWYTVKSYTGYLHTAVGPATNSLANYPANYRNHNRPSGPREIVLTRPPHTGAHCDSLLRDDVARTWVQRPETFYATLLATRSTGDVNYLP
jgi:hypothetical protein